MTAATDKAIALHEQAQRDFDRIRGNQNLSDTGKQLQLAKAYSGYRSQLDTVQQDDANQRETQRQYLTRRAFGIPTNDPVAAMSYRDAQARAEAITDPQIAHAKMALALDVGDTLQAQAIAANANQRAQELGGLGGQPWNSVVDAYTAAKPVVADALDKLSQLQAHGSVANQFNDAMYFHPQKPSELQQLHDAQIDNLAATAPVA